MMGGARHRVAADAIAAYVEEFALQCDLRDKLAIQKLASNVASLAAENVYQSLRIEWDSGYRVGLHLGSTRVTTEEEKESAAPQLMADAWDQGYRAGMFDKEFYSINRNPYRNAATNYIPDSHSGSNVGPHHAGSATTSNNHDRGIHEDLPARRRP